MSRNRDRIVRAYRENPETVNQPFSDGNYPLVFAVENGTPRIVQLLLEMGANPNVHSENPDNAYTPLILAVTDNKTAMVRLLLAHGANVNLGNPHTGETPLSDAIWNLSHAEFASYEIFNMLMSKNPNPDVLNEEKSGLYLAAEDENMDIARILLAAGASVNHGFPLHVAIQEKNPEVLQQFLKWGANPNLKHNGQTPLHLAVAENEDEMVDALLEAGADPHLSNNAGQTALNKAQTNAMKNRMEPQNLRAVNLNKPNWFANLGITYVPKSNEAHAAKWFQQRGIAHGNQKTRKSRKNDKKIPKN